MRLNVALIGLCAVLLSACARDPVPAPAPAADPPKVTNDVQAAEAPTAELAAAAPTEPCADAMDQRSMTACWGGESQQAQERVDAAVKTLDELIVSKRGATVQQKLQEDQARWQAFVDAHCGGLYGELYAGGSAAPMTVAVCRWQLAQTRLQQLTTLTEELDR